MDIQIPGHLRDRLTGLDHQLHGLGLELRTEPTTQRGCFGAADAGAAGAAASAVPAAAIPAAASTCRRDSAVRWIIVYSSVVKGSPGRGGRPAPPALRTPWWRR